MDEAHAVRGVHALRDLLHHLQLLLERELVLDVLERAALDELHDDVRPAGLLAHLVDAADVLVLDARLGPRLDQEALGQVRARSPRMSFSATVRSSVGS